MCVCLHLCVCAAGYACVCVCVYNYVHMCSDVCVNMKSAHIGRLLKVLQTLTKWDDINNLLLSVIIIHQRYYLFGKQVLLVCMYHYVLLVCLD